MTPPISQTEPSPFSIHVDFSSGIAVAMAVETHLDIYGVGLPQSDPARMVALKPYLPALALALALFALPSMAQQPGTYAQLPPRPVAARCFGVLLGGTDAVGMIAASDLRGRWHVPAWSAIEALAANPGAEATLSCAARALVRHRAALTLTGDSTFVCPDSPEGMETAMAQTRRDPVVQACWPGAIR